MRVPVRIDDAGELVLANPNDTGMYIEVDDACAPMLDGAPVGTRIDISGGED